MRDQTVGSEDGKSDGRAASPLDAMAAAPEHHSILIENDRVRVLDTRLGPGEKTAMHSHEWAAALYVLSWSDFVRRDASGAIVVDSRAMPSSPNPGEALWLPALTPHLVENVGDRDLHIIAVELKQPPSPPLGGRSHGVERP